MQHGSITAYTHGGCRCDRCRAAMTEYHRRHRRERRLLRLADELAATLGELGAGDVSGDDVLDAVSVYLEPAKR